MSHRFEQIRIPAGHQVGRDRAVPGIAAKIQPPFSADFGSIPRLGRPQEHETSLERSPGITQGVIGHVADDWKYVGPVFLLSRTHRGKGDVGCSVDYRPRHAGAVVSSHVARTFTVGERGEHYGRGPERQGGYELRGVQRRYERIDAQRRGWIVDCVTDRVRRACAVQDGCRQPAAVETPRDRGVQVRRAPHRQNVVTHGILDSRKLEMKSRDVVSIGVSKGKRIGLLPTRVGRHHVEHVVVGAGAGKVGHVASRSSTGILHGHRTLNDQISLTYVAHRIRAIPDFAKNIPEFETIGEPIMPVVANGELRVTLNNVPRTHGKVIAGVPVNSIAAALHSKVGMNNRRNSGVGAERPWSVQRRAAKRCVATDKRSVPPHIQGIDDFVLIVQILDKIPEPFRPIHPLAGRHIDDPRILAIVQNCGLRARQPAGVDFKTFQSNVDCAREGIEDVETRCQAFQFRSPAFQHHVPALHCQLRPQVARTRCRVATGDFVGRELNVIAGEVRNGI